MSQLNINEIKKKQKSNKAAAKDNASVLGFLNKDIQLFGNSLSDKVKEEFYHQLATLLDSGVDVRTTFDIVIDEQEKSQNKILFTNIREAVIKGDTLSGALHKSGKFTEYEYFSIQIGEESGRLVAVTKELVSYFNRKIKQRRQIVGALTYPAIVFCTSMGAVFFMINFVVPMFADVFKRFGNDLPAITALIISISGGFKAFLPYLLVSVVGLFIFCYWQRKQDWFRKYTSILTLKTPFLGDMVRKIYLARFCYMMNLLVGAKVPILQSLELIRKMVKFYPIECTLVPISDAILHGKNLHEAMAVYPIYEKKMVSLIKVGEEVNKLEQFFEKLAKNYTDDVEHKSSLLSSVVEPVLIIFLGLIVGLILVAMYLPMFQLGNGI
jgi:type IV pilus assembly protein PilC